MNAPLPAAITKVTTMRDRTIRLQIDVQEIHPEHMAELFGLNDKLGWFFFHEKPMQEIDIKDLPEITLESWEKPPSQRMRAVFYRLWEQTEMKTPFEEYYRIKMDQLIEMLKEKLN